MPTKRNALLGLGLLLAAILAPGCRATRSDAMRVAIIPPVNQATLAKRIEDVGERYHLPVDTISPEDMAGSGLSAQTHPVAFHVGGEGYLYKVNRPGDATEAVLKYLKDGGLLVVSGGVWPFFEPFDYLGKGAYSPAASGPATAPKSADPWIEKQLAAARKPGNLKFSRALGLHISGPGTTSFEAPEEALTFHAEAASKAVRDLPASWPFPASGERRYRPVSGANPPPGGKFTAIIRVKGASGKDYGPAAALIEHETGGRVLYVWEPILAGTLGEGIIRDAFILAAAKRAATDGDARLLIERINVLREAVDAARKKVTALVAPRMTPHYFMRQCDSSRAALDDARDMLRMGNAEPARRLVDRVQSDLAVLNRRIAAIAKGL